MNLDEANLILGKLKVVFPQWYEWMVQLAHRDDTIAAWQRALQSQTVAECEMVIEEWTTGKRTCPEAYERERIVFLLCESARQVRSKTYEKEQAKKALNSFYDHEREANERRKKYKTFRDKGLGNAMREIAAAVDSIDSPRSQWSDNEKAAFYEKLDDIVYRYKRQLEVER